MANSRESLEIRRHMNIDSAEITRRLILGSHKVDRMKSEVHETVMMILGTLRKCIGVGIVNEVISCESSTCLWEITLTINPLDFERRVVRLECWTKLGYGRGLGYAVDEPTGKQRIPFYAVNVQTIWEDLPTFVAGMYGRFPELLKELEPFIKAALVKFD